MEWEKMEVGKDKNKEEKKEKKQNYTDEFPTL